ncbi:probable 28S rRNA (cytosine-C(5))-methyltransferase [Toxorhynchites rutilus septentrionalis]|uniref:probable 28S rRNA (cytosine-C(5))-methyltransferase n=1 Tax=Toxorhynchites rutilus septentrionalis TaxID=329112 RepID=UPI00247AC3AC|nr:probable 28S rRNA (cytosine-C(5))-methyltransferase [Toxorhynchites rutilus septentrionalis]
MGRKINLADKPKKGPGRKARKQKDPTFSNTVLKNVKDSDDVGKLSHRQKVRAKKRVQKSLTTNKKASKIKEIQKQLDNGESETKKIMKNLSIDTDLTKSREKYAKATGKRKLVSNESDSVEEESDNSDTSENVTPVKCDILASDDNDSNSEDQDSHANVTGNLNDFLSSDEDGSHDTEDDSGEEDDESSMLPIERAGKKIKKRKEKEEHLAEQELQDSIANNEKFQFPTPEQIAAENLQDVHIRIKEVIGVLADFSANRDPNRSRTEYIDLLCKDLCLYYSYNEYFMRLLIQLFSPNELLEFLEASEVQRPLTIRTNNLKTRRRDLAQALINRGVNLDPIGQWSKEGLVVYSSQVPLGATPEYLAGQYMIQGASSMLPVIALAPEENERILDLCAAPGGKSSHIAALMKNTGVLFANDVNKNRLQAVTGNFHRLGIQNAIVTNIDGTKYRDIMTGFDRVLLDAPCTGSGVISKDPSVKTTKTEIDVQRCYNLQRKLLLTAIDCVSASSRTGGYIVYSTCSILPQENEWVLDYAIRKRNVRLVSTNLDFGTEGFVNFAGQKYHPSMKLARRFYPHTFNMDGFFVAKLQKFSDAIPSHKNNNEEEEEELFADESVDKVVQELPKKIDKRDWYYSDIIEKRKKQRLDPNHIEKVFQKPTANQKQKQDKDRSNLTVEKINKKMMKFSTSKGVIKKKKMKKN